MLTHNPNCGAPFLIDATSIVFKNSGDMGIFCMPPVIGYWCVTTFSHAISLWVQESLPGTS